jgi:hypothetical protein
MRGTAQSLPGLGVNGSSGTATRSRTSAASGVLVGAPHASPATLLDASGRF